MIHRPRLSADAARNRHVLQDVLDTRPAGKLELPPGEYVITDGLRAPEGWTVRGASVAGANGGPPGSRLVSAGTTGHPVLHVLGSDVSISDVQLCPPPADPGEHGGDRGTAITIGSYLYPAAPDWIERVDVRRVHVSRPRERHANCIAIMGAVRDIALHDVTVRGGYTGVAVHWGAVGADVTTIEGPTCHPHRLSITDLRVRDAVEDFYLSSVHDVRASGCRLRDVEMGFRLLPGDNTNRFAASASSTADIGARIEIADACVRWTGPRYGVRVAGWGRSEIDGMVSVLSYTDVVIRDCRLWGPVRPTPGPPSSSSGRPEWTCATSGWTARTGPIRTAAAHWPSGPELQPPHHVRSRGDESATVTCCVALHPNMIRADGVAVHRAPLPASPPDPTGSPVRPGRAPPRPPRPLRRVRGVPVERSSGTAATSRRPFEVRGVPLIRPAGATEPGGRLTWWRSQTPGGGARRSRMPGEPRRSSPTVPASCPVLVGGRMPEPVVPMESHLGVPAPTPRARRRRPSPFPVLAVVSAGGVLGALARYAISAVWPHSAGGFPWSTWVVNVSGCLLIGVLMALIAEVWAGRRLVRPFLGVGVLGGYTTFSTSIVDVQQAAAHGAAGTALVYLAVTLAGALLAVWAAAAGTAWAVGAHWTRRDR
jgi:protein CrcB